MMMGSRYNLRSRSKQPLILSLPKEVFQRILNYIPQNQTLNLRLVCKNWDNDVEHLYDYEVKGLDETSSHFQRKLQLRITKLTVHQLRDTSVLNSEGISIFKHPNLIRNLKIEPFAYISSDNLQKLLGLCAENLRILYLDLMRGGVDYDKSEQVLGSHNFTNLQYVRVIRFRLFVTDPLNPEIVYQMIENSSMPKLTGLEIKLDQSGGSVESTKIYAGSILRIVSKHGKHLEKLDLTVSDLWDKETVNKLPLTLQKDELLRIKAITGLKEFHVCFQPFELTMKDVWLELLSTQKNLVGLKTDDFPGGPISLPLCRQIVTKNFKTLVEIDIEKLNILAADPPFDLSVFQTCNKLEKLILKRDTTVNEIVAEEPYVREFNRLPESIKILKLSGLRILSEELISAFTQTNDSSTKGFKNMEELTLKRCGDSGLFGIKGRVLSEILMKSRPNLRRVRIKKSFNRTPIFGDGWTMSFYFALERLNLRVSEFRKLIRGSGRSDFGWRPLDSDDDSDDSSDDDDSGDDSDNSYYSCECHGRGDYISDYDSDFE